MRGTSSNALLQRISPGIFAFILSAWPSITLAIDFCEGVGYGIIGESGFTAGNNSTINGELIQCPNGDKNCSANTPTPTGELDTVDVDFPELDPASFPAVGGDNLTDEENIPAGSYGTLTATNKGILSFSGGDYYISKMDLNKQGTYATLGPGRYFINDIEMTNGTSIRTTGKVQIYLGSGLTGGNDLEFNINGPTTDLTINLYPGTTFSVGNSNQGNADIDFNGLLIAPYASTSISFGNNNGIEGSILSAGTVDVGNNTNFEFDEELAAEIGEALGCESSNELHHIRLIHDGQTTACGPQSISVLACANEDCSETYDGGTSGTLLAGANSLNWSLAEGETALSLAMYIPFDGTQPENIQFTRLSLSAAAPLVCEQSLSGSVNDASACDVAVSRAGFTFDVPDFVSAVPQSDILIQATRMDNGNECVPLFEDPADRTLSLTGSYVNPGTHTQDLFVNGTPLPGSVSLSFNANGVASLASLSYEDVGELQLSVRYDGSTETGDAGTVVVGSDTFVVRPAGFQFTDIICSDGTGLDSSAGDPGGLAAFCRAGEPFSFTIRAVNAAGATTPNYGRESTPASATLSHTLEAPATGRDGTLSYGSPLVFNTSDGTPPGVARVTDASWDEVGIITLDATEPAYLDRPGNVEGVSAAIGRFIPAYFRDLSGNYNLLPSCGDSPGFTYQGQAMAFDADPQVELQAVDITGSPVRNYFGRFFQYQEPATPDVSYTLGTVAAPSGVTVEPEDTESWTLSDHGDSYTSHTLTFATNRLRFTRPDVPITPFISPITMTLSAGQFVDDDGVCIRNSAGSSGCEAVIFQDMDTPEQRYGRLGAENISGPVDNDLAIRMSAEYWSVDGWALNTADNCTVITDTFAVLDDEDGLEPQSSGTGGSLAGGELPEDVLRWDAPGEEGSFLFRYDGAATWLQFDWNGDNTPTGPEALATFGENNRGHDRVISWDEI